MTETKKLCHFDFSIKNQTDKDEDENKTSSVSKNLEPFLNFNYFNEVNTFNECLGGYEDFTNTYHSVNKKLEEEREEEEMRSFYKEVIYTMTPAQEDALERYNKYIESTQMYQNEHYKSSNKYSDYSGSSDSESDY